MKVLVTQGFLATRSHASKSCLRILEPAGPRFAPSQSCLAVQVDEIVAKNFFRFMYFHGHSAARPLGWPLRMTSGKVRIVFHFVLFFVVRAACDGRFGSTAILICRYTMSFPGSGKSSIL